MKTFTITLFITCFTAVLANAQLRQDLNAYPEEYTASVSHTSQPSVGSWMNMLNMTMDHSYSMSFSNFGGQMQNLNAYTNHMKFDLSDRLDARVDVSLLHSPFGNSFMNDNSNLGTKIIIDQARLDYKLTDNAHISIQFSQRPGYYGYGHNSFGRSSHYSPFNRSPYGY